MGALTTLLRRHLRVLFALAFCLVIALGTALVTHRPFPPDATPEGAYARIALALSNGRPKDAFAYLETDAQWAGYLDPRRSETGRRAREGKLPGDRTGSVARGVAQRGGRAGRRRCVRSSGQTPWVDRAAREGLVGRDSDGNTGRPRDHRNRAKHALLVSPTRQRHLGADPFTAELQAEAERAARDLDVVERAADDYDRGHGALRVKL